MVFVTLRTKSTCLLLTATMR